MPPRPSGRGPSGRQPLLAASLAALLLVAACGGGAAPAGSGAFPAASIGATATPAGPAPSFAEPDPALVTRLVAAGAEDGDAEILALTRSEVTETGPRRVHYVQTLATGDVIEADVTVDPDVRGEPGIQALTATATADRIDVHLELFVDGTAMPDDVRSSLQASRLAGQLAAAGALAAAGPLAAGPRTADVDGVQVAVEWSISKASDEFRDSSIQALSDRFLPGKTATVMPIVKSAFAAKEGIELNAALDALLAELDALRKCAENPTNELTKKLYQEDPGEKDRILGEIAAARVDLIANTMVMELGVANELLADFGPKWLGWAIGPGTAWSKSTLQDLNSQRMDALRRGIPKCDDECAGGSGGSSGGTGGSSGGGSSSGGSSSGGSSSGGGASCEFPVTISGTATLETFYDGQTMYTAKATNVRWQFDPARSDANVTGYDLVDGQLAWSFVGPWGEDSCGLGHLGGSGTESLVPDERSEGGGEAPFKPGDSASLFIDWASSSSTTSFYSGEGTVRLHGDATLTTGCGDVSVLDPNMPSAVRPNTWLQVPSIPQQLVAGDRMQGTASATAGLTELIWTWDFRFGG